MAAIPPALFSMSLLRENILENRACKLGDLRVETATAVDLRYIDHLSRKLAWNIGYVPIAARENHLQQGNYWRVQLNGEPCGFLLIGAGNRLPTRLSQIAIDEQIWRNGVGQACIDILQRHAAAAKCPGIVASIADRLPMIEVAKVTGAVHVATRLQLSRRKRRVQHWYWPAAGVESLQLASKAVASYGSIHTVRSLKDYSRLNQSPSEV